MMLQSLVWAYWFELCKPWVALYSPAKGNATVNAPRDRKAYR